MLTTIQQRALRVSVLFLFLGIQSLFAQTFNKVAGTPFEGITSGDVHLLDIDGDDDLDALIIGNTNSTAALAKLYLNDGTGEFSETATSINPLNSSSSAFADVDGDNDLDILVSGRTGVTERVINLYLNDGAGSFMESSNPFTAVTSGNVAFVDVDGDDDQDVLISGVADNGPITELFLNDGAGNFTESNNVFARFLTASLAFADIDGDLDQDLFITGEDEAGEVLALFYLNDGSGSFTESAVNFGAVTRSAIAFGDVDGDSDQDLMISGRNPNDFTTLNLNKNDGAGNFSFSLTGGLPSLEDGVIAFADVDGDDDLDVFLSGNQGFSNFVGGIYANDGSGIFSPIDAPIDLVKDTDAAFGDIDGDGDVDLLVVGQNESFDASAVLYKNGPLEGDGLTCAIAIPIDDLLGQPQNVPQVSDLFNNIGYPTDGDPDFGAECFFDAEVNNSIWFSFEGDGNDYTITTVECNATDYIDDGDTQGVLYEGDDCTALTAIDCNDDGSQDYMFELTVNTQVGTTYHLLIDGYNAFGDGQGEFCLEVTNLTASAITTIAETDIKIAPNPTKDILYLEQVKAQRIDVLNTWGQVVRSVMATNNQVDLSGLTAGVYFLRIQAEEGVFSAKVQKQD